MCRVVVLGSFGRARSQFSRVQFLVPKALFHGSNHLGASHGLGQTTPVLNSGLSDLPAHAPRYIRERNEFFEELKLLKLSLTPAVC